jgi:hypothetical protein
MEFHRCCPPQHDEGPATGEEDPTYVLAVADPAENEGPRRPEWLRRAVSAAGLAALYCAVSALAVPGLVFHLTRRLPGNWHNPDTAMGLWFPWHVARQLRAGASPFYAPELGWPAGIDLTLMVWNVGCQLVSLPLSLVAHPVLAFNLTVLLLSTLNGLAFHRLGRRVGGSVAAGLTAGLLGVLAPFPLDELCSGRPEQGFLAPLAMATLALWKAASGEGRLKDGLFLGIWAGLAGACYWFYPYLLALCALPWLFSRVVAGRLRLRNGRGSGRVLALALVTCVLVALPFAWPVLSALMLPDSLYERSIHSSFSVWSSRGARLKLSIPWGGFLWPILPPKLWTTNMAVPLVLTAGGLLGLLSRRARPNATFFVALATMGALFALGPLLSNRPGMPVEVGNRPITLPFAWLDALPGFPRFWWPRRFLALFVVGAAGSAAAWVGARGGKRREVVSMGVLVTVAAAELFVLGAHSTSAAGGGRTWSVPVPLYDSELAAEPWSSPVIRLPLFGLANNDIVGQVFHHQPLFGGIAQTNPDFTPETVKAQLADPCIARLAGPANDVDAACPDLALGLRRLGLRWVLWNDESPGESIYLSSTLQQVPLTGLSDLRKLLGQPTFVEKGSAAWDLRETEAPGADGGADF